MKQHMSFGTESKFLDIGAGLGKPNLHVLLDPGVEYSFGVEHINLRWALSMLNLKKALTSISSLRDALTVPPVFFAHADATTLETLEPFSHVYMFDIGFPPCTLKAIATAFNKSKSVKCLISFHSHSDIVDQAGFKVQKHGKVPTVMSGSNESHVAFVYETSRQGQSSETNTVDRSAPVINFVCVCGMAGQPIADAPVLRQAASLFVSIDIFCA